MGTSLGIVVLIAMLIASPVSGSVIQYQVSATGEHLSIGSDAIWMSGSSDIVGGIPLPYCGDLFIGGYSSDLLGSGRYQTQGILDGTESMIYQYQTGAELDGVYRESIFVEDCGCGSVPEGCGDSSTATCIDENETLSGSRTSFSSLGMGDLLIIAEGTTIQKSNSTPDTLVAGINIAGNGMARVKFDTMNFYSLGNATNTGYTNEANYRTFVDGRNMTLSAGYSWSSFRPSFPTVT